MLIDLSLSVIKQIKNSIVFRIFVGILLVILPINILIISMSNLLLDTIKEQNYLKSEHALYLYIEQFDNQINYVNRFLFDETSTLTYLTIVQPNTETPENQYEYVKAQINYRNKLGELLRNNSLIDGAYTYFENNSVSIINAQTSDEGDKIVSYIKSKIYQTNSLSGKITAIVWEPVLIDNQIFLVFMNKNLASYYGAWIDVSKLMKRIVPINDSGNYHYIIRDREGQMLAEKTIKPLEYDQYDSIVMPSKASPIELVELVEKNRFIESIPSIANLMQYFSFLCLLAIPLIAFIINKQVINPVQKLLKAIHEIKNGQMHYRIKESKTTNEFHDINMSFNKMMEQIQHLTIDVYKSELDKQRVRMDYLTQQIQPHFILNTLNIIYSYEKHEYDLIQKMIINLTHYYRYIVRLNASYVAMYQELQHVKYYMEIQKVRYPLGFKSEITCEDTLSHCLLPPLLIQNFVENSFKNAFDLDKQFKIAIRVINCGHEKVMITIEDNGKGFDDMVLKAIALFKKERKVQKDLGIGIQNTIERLELLYHNISEIVFENMDEGGAKVCIIIPKHVISEENEDV